MMAEVDLIQVWLDELREAAGSGALVRPIENRAAVPLGALGVASGLVASARDSEDPNRIRRLRL